jgi:hypothetical protein
MRKFKWLMFISILFVLTGAIVTEVFANAHNYSIFGSAVSNTGGGDLSLDMALNAELTLENEINASVSLTGDTFTKGTLRLLMNDYGDNYKNELNSVWIDSVTTVVPLYGNRSIAALSPNWQDKNGVEVMKIYARYETDNGIQWVGPVYIKREPVQNVINLTVDINPATAVIDGAQWQYQGSLEWYNSGDTISIDINDFVSASNPFAKPKLTIEYRNITGWTLPATEIVYLKEGEDIHRTGMYSNFQCKVTAFSITDPAQAPIFNSAYWRVLLYESGKESAFFPDGYDLDLFPGETWIQFKDFDGYVAPGDQDNKIDFIAKSGQRHQYNVEYCKQIPETPKIYGMRKNVYTDKVVFSIYPVASPDCQARQDIKYNIYRSEFNDPQTASLLVEKTENTEITIEKKDGSNNGLEHGKIYFFWVTAVATKPAGSGESPLSSRGEAAFLKLDKPTDLVVEARITDNALQFNAVDGAEIYEIRRSQDDTNLDDSIPCDIDDSISLGTTEQTVFVDNQDLEAYIKYTYWVIPKNNFQEGATSDGKSAHIIISPPDSIQIDDSTCDCLSFDFPLNPMATHYRWDRSESPIPGKKSRTNEFTTPPFTDCQLISGVRYAYVVQACNAHGCSAWSNESPKTAKLCPVSGVKATDKDPEYLKGVKVEWTDSPKATYYKVHACTSATYSTGCWTMKTSSNPFLHDRSNDPQILNYPAYYYFVTAYNNDTESITVGVDEGSPYRCLYQMSPTTSYFGPDGGTGSFEISEVNGCGFVLKTDSESWITDLSPKTGGDGNETVTFKVAPYEGATERIGYIEVMGDDANKVVKHKVVKDSRVSLTVNVNPPNAGSVSIQPSPLHQEGNKYFFAKDTVVTVQAIPVEPFQFDYWSGFVHDTVNPKTFILSTSGTLTANFSYPKKTLSITGQGSVELDNEGNAHNLPHQILVDQGTDVIVKSNLTCNSGYQWDGVTNIDPTQQSVVVKVENDMSISVECCSGWNFSMNALRTDTGSDTESIQIGSGCQDFTNEAALDSRFYLTSAEKDVKYALQYKKATEEKPFWIIAVETGTEDVTLQWTAPEDEYFYQLRESASGIGKSVVWDMKATNSFTVSASSEVQYFTVHQSKIKWPMIIRSVRASSKPYVIMGVESVGYTMEAPPLLNPEYATSLVILPRLKADVRQAGNEVETWTIKVNPVGEYGNEEIATSTLIWEPMTFISEGHFRMYQGKDTLGDIVVENMRTTTSYDVTGDFGYQYFTIEWSNACQKKPVFNKGADQLAVQGSGVKEVLNWASNITPVNAGDFSGITFNATEADSNVVTNVEVSQDGTLRYTPANPGSTVVTVVMIDNNADSDCSESTPQTFVIEVTDNLKKIVSIMVDKALDLYPNDSAIDLDMNSTFQVAVNLKDIDLVSFLIKGFELKITFDSSAVEVLSYEKGSVFEGLDSFVTGDHIGDGFVTYAEATMEEVSVDSEKTLLVLNCKSKIKSGSTCLQFEKVKLSDPLAQPIKHLKENICLDIAMPIAGSSPEKATVYTAGAVVLNYSVSRMPPCKGATVKISYPTPLFTVEDEDIVNGSFMQGSTNGLIPVKSDVVVNAQGEPTGEIIWSAGYNGDAPPSGSGILFSVTLTAVDALSGTDPVTGTVVITDIDFSDPFAQPIEAKVQPETTIVVEPCYKFDLNCDCVVDIFDIVLEINEFGKVCEDIGFDQKFDFNNDCVVDIFDIVLIINEFGWECKSTKKQIPTSRKRSRAQRDISTQDIPILADMAVNEIVYLDLYTTGQVENMVAYQNRVLCSSSLEILDIQQSSLFTDTLAIPLGPAYNNEDNSVLFGMTTIPSKRNNVRSGSGNGKFARLFIKRLSNAPVEFTLTDLIIVQPDNEQKAYPVHVKTGKNDSNFVDIRIHAGNGNNIIEWDYFTETSYPAAMEIYRSTSSEGEYIRISDTPIAVDPELEGSYSFTDTSCIPGTTYFYRIKEISESKDVLNESAAYPQASENGDKNKDKTLKDAIRILQILTGFSQ